VRRSTSIWLIAGFFRRAWIVNSVVFGWPGWEALGRVQASLRAQRSAAFGGQDGLRRVGRSALPRDQPANAEPSQPAMRAHPTLAPFRALLSAWLAELGVFACVPPLNCGRRRHSARVGPPEVSSVGPHTVHNHCEPACEGDLRAFHAASLCDPHGPGSER